MSMRRPEDFEHFEQQLPGVKLHYTREGTGPTLVLLHGWPGFWFEWQKVIGPLAEGYDVIVPDLRGYGDSEKPDPSDPSLYTIEHAIDDVDALLDTLGIQTAYFVGHDWSALLMHKLVRKYRSRVIRGMTFDPITPDFGPFYLGFPHMAESWYSQFHQTDMAVELVGSSREACATYFRHFLDHWAYAPPLLTPEELEVYVDTFMKEGNLLGGFNWYRANLSVTSAPFNELDSTLTDVPMTFLSGMGDPVVPPVTSTDVARYYTNYTIEYVPDAGHFMMVEKPDLVVERIRRDFR